MGLETSGKGSQDYVGADSWCCMVECEVFCSCRLPQLF